jgi:signal transduction histidine kinase/NO-binding membrane sensor protein with MHYT domain
MLPSTTTLATSFDVPMVAFSFLIAAIASYTALELAARVAASEGRGRRAWLVAGACAMGLGIWSMHFTGMQAFHAGVAVVYDAWTTLASLLLAVSAAGVAFFLVGRPALRTGDLLGGGLAMGLGIAGMHYTGMAAMRMQAQISYDPLLVAASVAVAVAAAVASLWLAFRLRGETPLMWSWRKLGSAGVMGTAICGMHYSAMAAARFTAFTCPAPTGPIFDMASLGTSAVGMGTLLLLFGALISASRDQARAERVTAMALGQANVAIGQEVQRQAELLAKLLGNAPAAIAHLDFAGIVRQANPEFARMAGVPAGAPLARPIEQLFPSARETLLACLRERGETRRDFQLTTTAGGQATHWDLTCCPLPGPDGGHLLLAVDATQRVENERLQREKLEALEQADAAKDQFLGILSHELRTPINAVTGFGSILQDELMGPLAPEQHVLLAKMLTSADALLDLVNDLLEMTHIQAGRLETEPRPTELAEVARHVHARLGGRAADKGLRLELDVPAELPLVLADDLRVEQTLLHLIGNAIKFTHAPGRVTVRAYTAGTNQMVVEVEDTGEGIAPDVLPRLFQRFTQLDMSATREAGGTGLGLTIAKALVEAQGGTIGARSFPGRGSVFWFTLPLEPAAVPRV